MISKINSKDIDYIKLLYYECGYSMKSVANELGVSIYAIEYAMRKFGLNRRKSQESNRIVYDRKQLTYHRNLPIFQSERDLEMAGVMLYWAEGYKSIKGSSVDFANSDPKMIQIFLGFIRSSFSLTENKLRVYLYCHENQNPDDLIEFWSKLCNIPKDQFLKPYIRTEKYSTHNRIMKYGLIHIRYHDKKLLSEIKKMIHYYSYLLSLK